jgi:minor curlin subunit
MIRRALIARLIATFGSAVLVFASQEGRSQDYAPPTDIDQIADHYATIVQQGTGNTVSVEQRARSGGWYGSGASEALYTAAIVQNGTDQQAGVRQHGSGHQAAIDQNGTSNSAQVGQWGTSLKADVQQNGDHHAAGINQFGHNLAVEIDQSGNNRSFDVNQFGQGTDVPVTIRQY